MDPRGHNHHHNYHRRDDREEEFYPPPQYGNQPPPPQVAHVHHTSHAPAYPPPPPSMGYEYDAPPPPSMGYEYDAPPPPGRGYGAPPPPSMGYDAPPPPFPGNAFVEHVSHQPHHPQGPSFPHHPQHPSFPNHPEVDNRPTVRVYCKAKTDYSLSIRDGKVILARPDPSDPFQHWIKDEKFSTRVKDEEGFPSFALVNKATGQALKHSVGATHPVQLIPYKPDFLDESVLWTLSHDTGENFRTIRMVNNIRLNVDAYNGDKYHGGIRDGTTIVLWEWKKGENQRWKIEPY